METSIISTLGYGSGLDVPKLVRELAAASRDPKVARFDSRAKAVQTSISAVAQARSDLESFATSLRDLVAGGSLQSQPTVTDATILDAKARTGTRLSGFAGEIEVTQLARGQSIVSAYCASPSAPVGQGALTLTVGNTATAITIDATSDSLTGIAAAINGARTGVTATIVSDSGGARLMLKGPTGAASAFTLSGSTPALSTFAYPGAMTQVQSAQDAMFRVDGLNYARATNNVDDVIPGVTLTLKKAATGSPVSLGFAPASDTLKATIADFVSVFNTLKGHVADARAATRGDNATRLLDRQLSELIGKAVTSGSPASLSSIGIKTNREGTISFDQAVFNAAYAASPDAVEAIFSPTRDATHTALTDPGIGGVLDALRAGTTATNGALAGLTDRLGKESSALATDRTRMEAREAAYQARLEKQFGGLDARVGALKATQSYLDQQVKLWTQSR